MKAYAYVDDTFDAGLYKRVMRAAAGLGLAGIVVAGVAHDPRWIFVLSALGIYLTTTAIIGEGIFGLFDRLVDKLVREDDDSIEFDLNVGGGDRLARAAAAVVVFASIMDGVSAALDPVDYFLWTLAGFYAGMTAILAWDPAYRAVHASTRHRHAVSHEAPLPSRLMASKVGKVVNDKTRAAKASNAA